MRTHALTLVAALSLVAAPAFAEDPPSATPAPIATDDAPTTRTFEGPSPEGSRDAALEYRVQNRLGELRGVDLRDVHLHVVRGAVTLYGSVPNAAMHDRVIVTANNVGGVEVLRDELSLRPSVARGGGPTDDPSLAANARAVALRDPGVVGNALSVTSDHGVLTLQGHVATYADARRVVNTVRDLPGVRAVRSRLTVNESIVIPVHARAAHTR